MPRRKAKKTIKKRAANKAVPPKTDSDEEFSFGFILEVLTQGLYPNVLDVVREYVQNSYDAITTHLRRYEGRDYKIRIDIIGRSLFISDNGIGMNEEKIKQYRYAGFSEKKSGEEAGFRGIGKLAGISVAEKLIVSSSAAGIPKKYTAVFDAQAMLTEIIELKKDGQNVPLNELIQRHTELLSDDENSEEHYTIVELSNIRSEHSMLLDQVFISDYIARVCPVPFNSSFKYQRAIDKWLLRHVTDYMFVPHFVNETPIYKLFTNNVSEPDFFAIKESDEGEPIAYAWACLHEKEEQLPEIGPRGITFRLKNISIGDYEYVRSLAWKTSGHLAYWFLGEIHIIDPDIVPTSERSGFIDNSARYQLVERTQIDLIKNLNREARSQSGRASAEKKLRSLEELIANTELAFSEKTIPKESIVYTAAQLYNAVEKAEKGIPKLTRSGQSAAKQAQEKAKTLIDQLSEPSTSNTEDSGIFDIKEEVSLSKKEWAIYDLIIATFNDYLKDDSKTFTNILKRIHDKMIRHYHG